MYPAADMKASGPITVTSQPGTYVLVLACEVSKPLRVGRLGTFALEPGSYVYVGSAFGPGGLAARLRHHRQLAARPHWHIDYLRAACQLVESWHTADAVGREHEWARTMAGLPGAALPMPGFGASDCDCKSHLFWFARVPSIQSFRHRVGIPVSRVRLS